MAVPRETDVCIMRTGGEKRRRALLGSGAPSGRVLLSLGMVIVLLVSGMFYFRRMEQYYADIV